MARLDDRSEEHLQWLVENRPLNQKVTLDLHVAVSRNSDSINRNLVVVQLAQEPAGVAFSLWRAVFLSDLTEETQSPTSMSKLALQRRTGRSHKMRWKKQSPALTKS